VGVWSTTVAVLAETMAAACKLQLRGDKPCDRVAIARTPWIRAARKMHHFALRLRAATVGLVLSDDEIYRCARKAVCPAITKVEDFLAGSPTKSSA
jgi:hypothetical protein